MKSVARSDRYILRHLESMEDQIGGTLRTKEQITPTRWLQPSVLSTE